VLSSLGLHCHSRTAQTVCATNTAKASDGLAVCQQLNLFLFLTMRRTLTSKGRARDTTALGGNRCTRRQCHQSPSQNRERHKPLAQSKGLRSSLHSSSR
jgi:hypothetical protein